MRRWEAKDCKGRGFVKMRPVEKGWKREWKLCVFGGLQLSISAAELARLHVRSALQAQHQER